MKYFFLFILMVTIVSGREKAYGQSSQDSLWARSVRTMKKQWQLSDTIALLLLHAGQEQLRQTTLLNGKRDLSVEDREGALSQIQQQFHQRVQGILGAGQWAAYKELEEGMRARFINDANNKKIPFKEL